MSILDDLEDQAVNFSPDWIGTNRSGRTPKAKAATRKLLSRPGRGPIDRAAHADPSRADLNIRRFSWEGGE